MIRKDITYTDINDIQRTEPFYFHFTKLELAETELELGGIEETMKRLTETEDIKAAYKIFKDLLLSAYGKKSEDGKGFDKEDPKTGRPYRKELIASPALSELIMDLMNDVTDAAQFFRGMLPTDMQKEADANDAAVAANPLLAPGATPETVELETAPPVLEKSAAEGIREKSWDEYSREELLEMPEEQFRALKALRETNIPHDLLMVAYQRKSQK